MLIGELASKSDVTAKTLRFYERRGLIAKPARTDGGYRDYPPTAIERVAFIKRAQAAGLTLDQIRQILAISDNGRRPCEHVTTLVGNRLAEVDRRIRELRRVQAQLRDIAARADNYAPDECDGYCGLISPGRPTPR